MSDLNEVSAEVVPAEEAASVVSAPATPVYSNVRAMIESNPQFVESVRMYYSDKRAEYLEKLAEIETFIGFTVSEEQMSVRVAKIEHFLGIKPV